MTAEFDLSKANTTLTIAQKRALKNDFPKKTDDTEKITLKQRAIIALLEDKKLFIDGPGSPLHLLNVTYYYQFLSAALGAGMQLVGIEASDYRPGINQNHRHAAFVEHVLTEACEKGRRC